MASIYKRKNGTYCVRVSNGLVGGRQQLVSATYRPLPGARKAEVMADLQAFTKKFEKAVHDGSFVAGQREERTDPFFTEMSLEKYITDLYFPSVGHRLSPNTVKFYHKVCDQFYDWRGCGRRGNIRRLPVTHRNRPILPRLPPTPKP